MLTKLEVDRLVLLAVGVNGKAWVFTHHPCTAFIELPIRDSLGGAGDELLDSYCVVLSHPVVDELDGGHEGLICNRPALKRQQQPCAFEEVDVVVGEEFYLKFSTLETAIVGFCTR